MHCWNCGKQIPDTARACKFCEAPAEPEPVEEEIEAVREKLDQMPNEVMDDHRKSDIKAEVVSGNNTFDFAVESE